MPVLWSERLLKVNVRDEHFLCFEGTLHIDCPPFIAISFAKCVQELMKPPTGSGTESGETTAANWKWFSLMNEAIGGIPSIRPPCLIASA